MSETNPGYSDDQHAGEVGSRRATIGTATDPESVNVPPTRPGAAENAYEAEARRTPHETFVPDTLIPSCPLAFKFSQWATSSSLRAPRLTALRLRC